MFLAVVAAAVFAFGAMAALAQDGDDDDADMPKVHVEQWLLLGPIDSPFPAFNDEDSGKKMKAADLLAYEHMPLDDLWPLSGDQVRLIDGGEAKWTGVSSPDTAGVLIPPRGDGEPGVAYLAAYVDVPQWMEVDVDVRATQPFELFVDGESVAKNTKGGKMDAGAGKEGEAELEMGKHLMVVKTVYVPGDSLVDWRVDVNLSRDDDFDVDPDVSLDPGREMTIYDVLDGPFVDGVQVSPDGTMFLVTMFDRTPPKGTRESWVEIRRFKDGKLVRRLTDLSGVSNWEWAPTGN
ncbi:MAG: hypothetical protein PVF33_14300, partial [Candidatus Latescibacterota bacterium]